MTDISKTIGKRIRELRGEAELSQQYLADNLGVSRSSISQIENGERKITAEELLKLSRFLNTSCENLLGVEGEREIIIIREKTMPKKPEIRINVPQKNVSKFKEVLLYILNRV